ncbi:MAG: hypothetical protein KKF50_00070 [Nanoarchaeota archaeon]|nr:hypothetical protein [Nanoarchaeota archaeon]
MEEDDEPPNRGGISTLVRTVQGDRKSIILLPSESLEEIAVCNPAVCENHFIYRAREKANNRYGEKSVVRYRKLITLYQLSEESRKILVPEFEYEKDGIEDARVSKDGQYNIVYVGFNEDHENGGAKVALATTEDFKDIQKHGIIGPQVRLEEAIRFAGGPNTYYGGIFDIELRGERKKNPGVNPFVMDKDATIVYAKSGQPIFLHRVGNAIQATPFDSIKDLQNPAFWEYNFGKLEEDTILYPGRRWAPEKVGLGGTPITIIDSEGNERKIGHVHGVEKKESEKLTEYIYKSTIAEFDPETFHIKAIIRDPILLPDPKYIFIEKDGEYTIKKYINFATGIAIDPNDDSIICNYSGLGDYGIELRTNNLKQWLLKELSNPHNSIENWQRVN